MNDDFLSLFPSEPKPDPESRLRTVLAKTKPRKGTTYDEPERVSDEPLPHETEFLRPVGIGFLAKIVGKQPYQIAKRLGKCPVIGWQKAGGKDTPLYDFMTAVSYLIPPRGNIEEWFGQQNAASLPPYVNKMWWDSAHQRNRVMQQSGQLWHDDEARVVFGRAAIEIRQATKMWIEDLPEKDLLTDLQYNNLVDATNRLVDSVREILVDAPREHATYSMAATIKDELEAAGGNTSED